MNPKTTSSSVRVGIGGWLYEPWRGTFYPEGLAQARELEYASGKLDVIEINSTFYRTQSPKTFAAWRAQTPDDFVFAVKAPFFATNRKVLASTGEAIANFIASGIVELGPKLGPIVWEFAPTKAFDPADFEAFLKMIPTKASGLALRHALDVRHGSFMCAEYLRLARKYGHASVFTDADDSASFADVTGDFVYARLKRAEARLANGFRKEALERIAANARTWRDGGEPDDVPRVEPAQPTTAPRDVFILFISGAKEKAPAAAMALRKRLAKG